MVVGGELLASDAQTFLTRLEISDLPFGMTILVFLVSIEELASGCMLTKRVARWAECVLIFLHTVFVVGGWLMYDVGTYCRLTSRGTKNGQLL